VLEVIRTFVPAGIHHILIGPDHILFLCGLLLLGGSLWRLTKIVTAFTLGHSLTLSLASLGIFAPPPSITEPAIALTIVVVGADNLMRGDGKDLRALAALLFGLIHGFGFANVLADLGLQPGALAASLVGLNLGVEIGQLAIVATFLPLAWLLRSTWFYRRVVLVGGSGAIMLVAALWLGERLFDLKLLPV
jgi:hypothetical protein